MKNQLHLRCRFLKRREKAEAVVRELLKAKGVRAAAFKAASG